MPSSAFDLILITPDEVTPGQLSLLPALFEAGASYAYIRNKLDSPELKKGLQALIEQGFASKLILPSNHTSFNGKQGFSHVKEWERLNQDQNYLECVSYSTSVHALSDLIELDSAFQMVFYSPLFSSISKEGYGPKVDLAFVQEELQGLRKQKFHLPKIIGLGGITSYNIMKVKEAGFDGAALLGSVWQASDPLKAFRVIKAELEEDDSIINLKRSC